LGNTTMKHFNLSLLNAQFTTRRVKAFFTTIVAITLVSIATLAIPALPAHAAKKTIHFYNDIAGSPQMAVDADTGQVLWKENYRPYGERINNSPASATGRGKNEVYFHGKQAEPLNGGVTLQYFGARYYMPGLTDRFTSVDPVHFMESSVHSFNRFAYGNNNPYKFRDPDGRSPESPLMDTVVGDPQSVAVFRGMMYFGEALTFAVPAAQLVRGGVAMYRGMRGAEAAAAAGEVTGEAAQVAKHVPNPFGKAGGPAHQAKVAEVAADIEARGLTASFEHRVVTGGGSKGSRFVDVVAKDAGGTVKEMHQVGRQTQAGNPVARETRALKDIEGATGVRPQFHPYN
jgi:RHS repeat-associated protein